MNRLTDINTKLAIFFILSLVFMAQISAQKQNDKFVLVLDAGHGGHDGGTSGLHLHEKYIALDITLKVGNMIKDYYGNDIKVVYTRKTDVFVELAERANIANRNHADFFISIHCNSFKPRPAAYGTETFVLGTEQHRTNDNFSVVKRENSVILLEDNHEDVYQGFDPNSPESMIGLTLMQNVHLDNSLRFARAVEDKFVHKYNRHSRGVKQDGFVVLWRTAMPSVLIETGFLSNPEESQYLDSEKGKRETADAIFEAFKIYKKEWDIRRGNSVRESAPVAVKEPVKKVEPEKPVEGKYFTIQFLTSKRKFRANAPQLKGLKDITIQKVGKFYKYYYGKTSFQSKKDYNLTKVKRAGFPDAFVVEVVTDEAKAANTTQPKTQEKPTNGYRIQLLTSQRNYDASAPQMKGVKPIDKYESDGLYKYFYGWYNTEADAKAALPELKSKGFLDAFVVRFEGGRKK